MTRRWIAGKTGYDDLEHIASENTESDTLKKREICLWISMIHSDEH
jgi:hypothetical protein